MSILSFVVLALANWRLASLLSREGGPWDLLYALRYRLGVRYNERNELVGQGVISRGLICMWCNSVWIGLAQAILFYLFPTETVYVCLVFALSAATVLLEEAVIRGEV